MSFDLQSVRNLFVQLTSHSLCLAHRTGEPNEHLSTLLSHAQLGTARNPQAQKTLFMGFRAELIRYLDVPPSARKPRGAFARQDSASEDETGAEVLSSSDLSALLNRIGLLEWKGEIESLLTAYSKGLRGSAREKETWVRGPAVVAGAIRAVAEARSVRVSFYLGGYLDTCWLSATHLF